MPSASRKCARMRSRPFIPSSMLASRAEREYHLSLVDALRQERQEKRGLALTGMIERVALDDRGRDNRVRLDPVDRIIARRLPRVVVGHRLRAPPSLSALRLEEAKDSLPGCELEGEVGRHAGREILGLMMDDDVNVPEADA